MDTGSTLGLALVNLTSPPLLAFVLGLVAAGLRSDIRLPEAVYQATSMYLLLAIDIKGGVALRDTEAADVVGPIAVSVALGVVIPIAAFWLLRWWTRLSRIDRGAMAAHYGSTSLVTFTAALVFLEGAGIAFEGYVTTLLTVLEIPGIIVGLMLALGGSTAVRSGDPDRAERPHWGETLREVILGRSVLLLLGGLLLGWATGPVGYARIEPFFGDIFTGVLTVFLLEMGLVAGQQWRALAKAGPGLVAFALVFPVLAGTVGVAAGLVAGMGVGGAMALGTLCASASYIAAPAATRLALPNANPGVTLLSSLGMTFPFNLIVGIPLYLAIAQFLSRWI